MAAQSGSSNVSTIPLSNEQDKCVKRRLVYRANLSFLNEGDSITITVASNNRALSQFEMVRGLFFTARCRTNGSGNGPWFRIEVLDTGQFWDIGNEISAVWITTTLQAPVFQSPSGKVKITLVKGTVPTIDGDIVVLLTNFDLEPYSTASDTSDEVG